MTLQEKIRTKISSQLEPVHLEIINESHMHGVPPGSESHFKVVVVSERFAGLMLLKRHRLVNEALAVEIQQMRAMSLHTHTPLEWQERGGTFEPSPTCVGGSKLKA
jgi:BolA protein